MDKLSSVQSGVILQPTHLSSSPPPSPLPLSPVVLPSGKLKGVMRVGAFARGLLLRGECSVDLVLMCNGEGGRGCLVMSDTGVVCQTGGTVV